MVAYPLRVPRMRTDGAELVRSIVMQGKAQMTAKPLHSRTVRKAVYWRFVFWMRAVNGMRM